MIRFLLWTIQILSIGTVLWCSWVLLNRDQWLLVTGLLALFASLYAEHQMRNETE